eukprot:Platyproteum_vivax@DN6222_c0_g1_i2.p1
MSSISLNHPLTSTAPVLTSRRTITNEEPSPFETLSSLPFVRQSTVEISKTNPHSQPGVHKKGVNLMINNSDESVLYARECFEGNDGIAMRQRLVACPNGHLVVLVGAEVGHYAGCTAEEQEWKCQGGFGCYKTPPNDSTLRYRCSGCNFDMCYGCWHTLKSANVEY